MDPVSTSQLRETESSPSTTGSLEELVTVTLGGSKEGEVSWWELLRVCTERRGQGSE